MSPRPLILVADDDPQVLNVLQLCLIEDFELVLAGDGIQAVERAVARQPDLILMDIKMPGLKGLEAIRQIRKLGIDVPVIVMTGFSELLDDTEIRHLKVAHCLAKPFDIKAVIRLIRDLTHHGKSQAGQN
jgi:two-component system response regulator (stage 0 sporulation protein F)